ncbi:MAG: diaminopimelate epimerase [Bacteroidales bacterium]|nr:diaminopimelate epimerase [Bacteroidales bacterium]MCF8405567.1 diaminopimelate epimerase [Bacteroidales bacterium]
MTLTFSKYHGTGNDFILIDNRQGNIFLSETQIAQLCHRNFGIGADGLIYLLSSSKLDFRMEYYNADGREGTMCGNGGRCIMAFAKHLGIIQKKAIFEAIDGIHEAEVISSHGKLSHVKLGLNKVEILDGDYSFINTGSPHYIEFIDHPKDKDIFIDGKNIRWDEKFQPEGTNVNFVTLFKNSIFVQTYERGVENVTLSCGTGITASAIASASRIPAFEKGVNVETNGGKLRVEFDKKGNLFTNIQLSGPAFLSFTGHTEI